MAQSAVIGFQPEHRTLPWGRKNRDRKVNMRTYSRASRHRFLWTGCGWSMRMVVVYALEELSALVFLAPACLGHATLGTRLSLSRILRGWRRGEGKLEKLRLTV